MPFSLRQISYCSAPVDVPHVSRMVDGDWNVASSDVGAGGGTLTVAVMLCQTVQSVRSPQHRSLPEHGIASSSIGHRTQFYRKLIQETRKRRHDDRRTLRQNSCV